MKEKFGGRCIHMTEGRHSHVYLPRLSACSVTSKSVFFYSNGMGRQAVGKEGGLLYSLKVIAHKINALKIKCTSKAVYGF